MIEQFGVPWRFFLGLGLGILFAIVSRCSRTKAAEWLAASALAFALGALYHCFYIVNALQAMGIFPK